MKKPKDKGFTLIEILIVMLIISIVGSIAILTINKNKSTQAKSFSNKLYSLFKLAEDQALLQPTVLGARIENHRISFYEYHYDPDTNTEDWVLTNNKLFAPIDLPSNTWIKLGKDPSQLPLPDENIHPQIIFSKNGEVNSFFLLLGKNSHSALYKISGDTDGTLHEEAL